MAAYDHDFQTGKLVARMQRSGIREIKPQFPYSASLHTGYALT
ncbi:hypothetical protein COXBURSA331_A2053 [Coxiella burnetii RSA 331]|uniref:Uncharacterized protein n=1 Tax=Coxiella burnetii (strain Dugway 5J108-111) TaxID=434922 RepID=A9KF23_COXBN|nr:hypothetical protein CBUD_0082 [Coxiella burnetii Dugway 5J108-111]ABX78186.1 hypothetical protein COXBURSA331_A2053 [Coxiella burnetii RSA 331]